MDFKDVEKKQVQKESLPEMMEYSVKGSDTLASIALKFNTTTSKLTRMNRLSSRLLYPGQTLFVPVKIDLLEREAHRKQRSDELELVTKPPQSRPFPTRQGSLSPDHQMEELLRKKDNGKDVVSEKYLRINGRFITDGQGVVPGILLVTPQTVMFNPSVSDHLVIDRGRDAYTVRSPMKAIKDAVYYQDIAAMVLGDTSAEFIPDVILPDETLLQQKDVTMDTSNYVSQDTVGMLSETQSSDAKERGPVEPMSLDQTSSDCEKSRQVDHVNDQQLFQNSEISVNMSHDETFTNCSCSKMPEDGTHLNAVMDKKDDSYSNFSTETSSSRGTFTNHDRVDKDSGISSESGVLSGFEDGTGTLRESSEKMRENTGITRGNAEITRDSIDIMDTKCTSTPRKVQENTLKNSKVEIYDDSGLIYTKIQPRNTVKRLTGNAIKLESTRKNEDESFMFVDKSNAHSFSEGESLAHIDASRDSGISEGSSFQSSKSSIRPGSVVRVGTDVTNRPMSPRTSCLSNEAREWLGKRGIRYSIDSEDEGQYSETSNFSQEELSTPRPAALSADELVYLCLRIHKSHWCRPSALQTHIMGIPQNRDMQRMEYWFAVPQERINQLHTFLTTWRNTVKPDSENTSDDFSRTSDGLSIVDDTFARPSAEELLLERFEQAKRFVEPYHEGYLRSSPASGSRKSTISSLNEEDVPELTDESNILEKMQIAALSRELPSRTIGHKWNLVYSTAVHGISLKTLYRNTQDVETPILLVVVDQEGMMFGAFMSDPPKVTEGYYGTGESMLFTFKEKKIKAYRWTGINSFFIKGDSRCLSIGGGDGMFGLWLDEDLNHGGSHSCKTFDNETLSSKEDFICRGLEAWSFE